MIENALPSRFQASLPFFFCCCCMYSGCSFRIATMFARSSLASARTNGVIFLFGTWLAFCQAAIVPPNDSRKNSSLARPSSTPQQDATSAMQGLRLATYSANLSARKQSRRMSWRAKEGAALTMSTSWYSPWARCDLTARFIPKQ